MIQWLEECYIRNAAVIQHFIQHPSVLPSDLLEDTGPFLSSTAPRWAIKKQLLRCGGAHAEDALWEASFPQPGAETPNPQGL